MEQSLSTEIDHLPSRHTDGLNGRLVALSRVIVALMLIMTVLGTAVLALLSTSLEQFEIIYYLLFTPLIVIANGVVGWLIIARYPRHIVGWLVIVIGWLFALRQVINIPIAMATGDWLEPSNQLVVMAYWFNGWIYFPQYALPIIFLPLYFPTGRLLSQRWRVVAVAGVCGILIALAGVIVHPGPYASLSDGLNPFNVPGGKSFGELLVFLFTPLLLFAFTGALASILVRYRRSDVLERTQLQWLFFPIAIYIIWILGILAPVQFFAPELMVQIGAGSRYVDFWVLSALIPIVIGIAILRHRLFDIDIIIRKTLIYGALTGIIVLIYILLVGGATTALQTQNNVILSLLALAAAGAAFVPARRRLTDLVNRYLPYTPPPVIEEHEMDTMRPQIAREQNAIYQADSPLIVLSRVIFVIEVVLFIIGMIFDGTIALKVGADISVGIASIGTFLTLVCGIVALLIIAKHPRHTVGWFMLFLSFNLAISTVGGIVVIDFIDHVSALSIPYSTISNFLIWVMRWNWLMIAVAPVIILPLYFPTGRLL